MDYRLIDTGEIRYLECVPDIKLLSSEADVLDLLVSCGENDTNMVLLHSECLPDDFFDLKTGFAGVMLQKLINYHVRLALVMSDDRASQGRFRDLAIESTHGRHFGVFDNRKSAEQWLIGRP